MALSKDSKKEILQDLITKLKESKGVVLTDYQGMNVFQISRLRNELKGKKVEFKIVKNTVKAVKAGKVEYRADKFSIIHAPLGKTNFDKGQLLENFATFIDAIIKAKPSSAKGRYIRSITISSTMGPGVRTDPQKIDAWVEKQKK